MARGCPTGPQKTNRPCGGLLSSRISPDSCEHTFKQSGTPPFTRFICRRGCVQYHHQYIHKYIYMCVHHGNTHSCIPSIGGVHSCDSSASSVAEHWFYEPRVVGSSPSLNTPFFVRLGCTHAPGCRTRTSRQSICSLLAHTHFPSEKYAHKRKFPHKPLDGGRTPSAERLRHN